MHKVEVSNHDKFEFVRPSVIGSGGNSGFQALNLAAQFGATKILLIGFDMHIAAGVHWYGCNAWHGANNPNMPLLMRWRNAFTAQAKVLEAMGIDVVNASADSALKCFRHAQIDQALNEWGL